MKIANPADSDVCTDDHPTGVLAFRYLLRGREHTPDNFMMVIAENVGHFQMVRHRHNFDQFRYVVSGQMNLGDGLVAREGELCYFPEGTPYGPQDDLPGPVVLTVQMGGASGFGYMSPEQYRAGYASLEKTGRFEGPVYLREVDGKLTKKFGINAVWEEIMASRMLIPAPRYEQPIIMKPKAFRWTPVPQQAGCHRKLLGSFSERGTGAEMLKLERGATLRLLPENTTRLLFVVQGAGTFAGAHAGLHFAIQVDPGESGEVVAADELVVLGMSLPTFETGWQQAELAAVEPAHEESVV